MAEIDVQAAGQAIFHVVVRDRGTASEHEVIVPEGYAEQLGATGVEPARLVEASFRFLLDREPKESILASFELPVIERYFPEYPAEIGALLDQE